MITVVGIGADGWDGLPRPAQQTLQQATHIYGAPRHLAMLPPLAASTDHLPAPLLPALTTTFTPFIKTGVDCHVLASGDPMFYGIGTTLTRQLGTEHVRVIPHVSSASLACAEMGWNAATTPTVSILARPISPIVNHLTDGQNLLVLSEDERSPHLVAHLLCEHGCAASEMTVLSELGGPAYTRCDTTADHLSCHGISCSPLNVIAIHVQRSGQPSGESLSLVPGRPTDIFTHDGQITKPQVRAMTLAALAPQAGQTLWDVGAGSGSVSVEWSLANPTGRVVAFEPREDRARSIHANAAAFGTSITVIPATPWTADTLPKGRPDKIFIGGGITDPRMFPFCWSQLAHAGTLVANAVTVEAELLLLEIQRTYGGTLTRLSIEQAEPLGSFHTWRPTLPILQLSVSKESA